MPTSITPTNYPDFSGISLSTLNTLFSGIASILAQKIDLRGGSVGANLVFTDGAVINTKPATSVGTVVGTI